MSNRTKRGSLAALLTSASAGAIITSSPVHALAMEAIPEAVEEDGASGRGFVAVTGSRIWRDEVSSFPTH